MTPLATCDIETYLSSLPSALRRDPRAHVVCALLRAGQEVGVRAWPETEVEVRGVDGLVCDVERTAAVVSADAVVLVMHTCAPDLLEFDVLVEAVERDVVDVHHAVLVTNEVWWVTSCLPARCDGAAHLRCGPGGPNDRGPDTSPPAVRRDVADDALRCQDAAQQREITEALQDVPDLPPRDVLLAWRRLIRERPPESTTDLVIVLASLEQTAVRDALMWDLLPELSPLNSTGKTPEDGAGVRSCDERVLLSWLPAVASPHRATWLCLIAVTRWRAGSPKSACEAAREALRLAPTSSLARLMVQILAADMPFETAVAGLPGDR